MHFKFAFLLSHYSLGINAKNGAKGCVIKANQKAFHPRGSYPSTSHSQQVRFHLSIPLVTQSCLARCLLLTRSCRVQRKGTIRAHDSLKAPETCASGRTEHDFGPFWSTPRPGVFCPRHFKHCKLHCVLYLQLLAHISTGHTQHYSDLTLSISSISWGQNWVVKQVGPSSQCEYTE